MFLSSPLADLGEVLLDVLFPFLNPILKHIENLTENVRFGSEVLTELWNSLFAVMTGSAIPFYLSMSFYIVFVVFVIRFLLLK